MRVKVTNQEILDDHNDSHEELRDGLIMIYILAMGIPSEDIDEDEMNSLPMDFVGYEQDFPVFEIADNIYKVLVWGGCEFTPPN